MATTFVTTIHNYMGLSNDTKPTSGVPTGSTYHELNTGERYIYDGTVWVEDLSMIHALDAALNG